jgi:hypothetical protein
MTSSVACVVGLAAAVWAGSAMAAAAQGERSPSAGIPASTDARSPWRALWGEAPEPGVFYLPVGFHNDSVRLRDFQLLGGIYRGVFGMTFINSYGTRTWSLGFQRNVYRFRRLSLGYGIGLMYGYGGRLADSHSLPLRHTFLFEHDVNPAVGVPARLALTKHLQLETFITPVVSLGGLKMSF